jgi:hypothetical protein
MESALVTKPIASFWRRRWAATEVSVVVVSAVVAAGRLREKEFRRDRDRCLREKAVAAVE